MNNERYNEEGDKLIFSHGNWMTEEEDARACDEVDSLIQDNIWD